MLTCSALHKSTEACRMPTGASKECAIINGMYETAG